MRTAQTENQQRGMRNAERGISAAFTVTELLVVITIIGVVAAISIPALKGIGQSQTISNGARQLLEDLALARQYAILNRSVVHMLFVPPAVTNLTLTDDPLANRLKGGAYTTYAIYAERTIGDQPGQSRPRYMSRWKTLPDGVIIAPQEFQPLNDAAWKAVPSNDRPLHYQTGFWFPTLTNQNTVALPHISFDVDGSVRSYRIPGNASFQDEYLYLARGSVLVARDDKGQFVDLDVRESPPGNSTNNYHRIRIDGLTGRPYLERAEIQ
jgi:prepilin-type N-terminal cleavage/methylation domain-containing protein